jgi:hypothetical protein
MNMNMYEYIKTMSLEEMKAFIFWVYMNGNKDGNDGLCDDMSGYFGGYLLKLPASDVLASMGADQT